MSNYDELLRSIQALGAAPVPPMQGQVPAPGQLPAPAPLTGPASYPAPDVPGFSYGDIARGMLASVSRPGIMPQKPAIQPPATGYQIPLATGPQSVVGKFHANMWAKAKEPGPRAGEPIPQEELIDRMGRLAAQLGEEPSLKNIERMIARARTETAMATHLDVPKPSTGVKGVDVGAELLGTLMGFMGGGARVPGGASTSVGGGSFAVGDLAMKTPQAQAKLAQIAQKTAPMGQKVIDRVPPALTGAVERFGTGMVERAGRGALAGGLYGGLKGTAEGGTPADIAKEAAEHAAYFALFDTLIGGAFQVASPLMNRAWLRANGYKEVGAPYGLKTGVYQKGYGTDKATKDFIVAPLTKENAASRLGFATRFRQTQPDLVNMLIPHGQKGVDVMRVAAGGKPRPDWEPSWRTPIEERPGLQAGRKARERLESDALIPERPPVPTTLPGFIREPAPAPAPVPDVTVRPMPQAKVEAPPVVPAAPKADREIPPMEKVKAPPRQYHEMTRAELITHFAEKTGHIPQGFNMNTTGTNAEVWGRGHELAVKRALSKNEHVTPEVLADYPHLAPKAPKPEAKQEVKPEAKAPAKEQAPKAETPAEPTVIEPAKSPRVEATTASLKPGDTVYTPKGRPLTVVDASDPAMLTVRNENGTEYKIGRRGVQAEAPAPEVAQEPEEVKAPEQTAPQDTAGQIESAFGAMADGISTAGQARVQELVEKQGYVGFIKPEAAEAFRSKPEYQGWREEVVGGEVRFYPPTEVKAPEQKQTKPETSLQVANEQSRFKPDTVFREVRDFGGNLLGYETEKYNGTKEDARRAAEVIEGRLDSIYPDWSNMNSRIGATDSQGNPKYTISPNLRNISDVNTETDAAKYTWGDLSAGQAQARTETPKQVETKVPEQTPPKEAPKAEVPAETPSTLANFGLNIERTVTKNNKPVWNVSGETKTHKDALKGAGGRWFGPAKVWSFYGEADPTAKILEALGTAKQEVAATTETKTPEAKETPAHDFKRGDKVKYTRLGQAEEGTITDFQRDGKHVDVKPDGWETGTVTQAVDKLEKVAAPKADPKEGITPASAEQTGTMKKPEDTKSATIPNELEPIALEAMKFKDAEDFAKNAKNVGVFDGRAVWIGMADVLDGKVIDAYTYEQAKEGDFHHNNYMSPKLLAGEKRGKYATFFISRGKVEGNWRDKLSKDAVDNIAKELKIPKDLREFYNQVKKQGGEAKPEDASPPAFEQKATQEVKIGVISEKELGSPSAVVANYVKTKLESGEKFGSTELFLAASEAFGGKMSEGKFTPKDAYDAMELGVNHYLLKHKKSVGPMVDATMAAKALERIESEILAKIPTQTKRTDEQDEFQQFSTPPNLAYVAAWAANITNKDIVLEPSAGIGVAVFGKTAGAEVVVNELSPRRAEVLKEMGFDRVFTENAEQLNNILPKDVTPSVVLMNPPFSATAGRLKGQKKTKFAEAHIEQALMRLEPGGRLVAIVGRGMADNAPTFRNWWKEIKEKYNVRANVGIDGSNYKKYGTSFDVQLLVIDKTGATPVNTTVTGKLKDMKEVLPLLEGIKYDRREVAPKDRSVEQKPGKQVVEADVKEGRGETGPKSDIPVPTGKVDVDQGWDASTGHDRPESRVRAGDTKPERSDRRIDAITEPRQDDGVSVERVDKAERTGEAKDTEGRGVVYGGESKARPDRTGEAREDRQLRVETEIKVETELAQRNKDDLGDAVFTQYTPQKLKIPGAKQHPGPLAQSAAMDAVDPPNPTYTPNLPKEVISEGKLSVAQLEAVVYAGQAHSQVLPNGERRGFFIGDGTGVGKGREISGIILDNLRQGRSKAVWVSKNSPLFNDAQRDFGDIGGDKDLLFDFGKIKLGTPIKQKQGVIFTTYSTMGQGLSSTVTGEVTIKEGSKSRLEQLVRWLGEDFDGVIAFDEAHEMQNSLAHKGARGIKKAATKALAGVELQKRLPNARIVYVSATGATEVMNLAYAERLGLWGEGTPFANKSDFINRVQAGGLAAMELVARDMKAMGAYVARSLDYSGVTYDRIEHDLSPEQTEIYDAMAHGWQIVFQNIHEALKETGQAQDGNAKGRAMGQFWGSQQRFFNQVLTSMQMPSVIKQVKEDLKSGHAVVMQLVNTNEAAQNRQLAMQEEGESLDSLDLTPREMLMQYLEKSFPTQQYEEYMDADGNTRSRPVYDSQGNPVENAQAVAMKEELLTKLGAMRVPEGPLEIVLNTFGVDNVAEITGRTRRVVKVKDEVGREKAEVQNRTQRHIAADTAAFMEDKKQILIFSDAGGTGRSYHAALTAKNQRKRVHYLIQPGWRADNAVQGFGRTHRTNQASAPHYVLVTTNLKGQKRFISSIARRLDQLGALTKGQRQTGSQGLFSARDNLESELARDAMQRFYEDLIGNQIPGLETKDVLTKMGLQGLMDQHGSIVQSDDLRNITKFLNRILVLDSGMQNAVFDAFSERMDMLVKQAIKNGTLDMGLENFRADKVKVAEEKTVYTDEKSGAETKYLGLEASHKNTKLTYEEVKKPSNLIAFYENTRSKRIYAAYRAGQTTTTDGNVVNRITLQGQTLDNYNTVTEPRFEQANYRKLDSKEAKSLWGEALTKTPDYRTEKVHLISGTILPIWDRLPDGQVRVVRVRTDDGRVLLGRIVPERAIDIVLRRLGVDRARGKIEVGDAVNKILEQGYAANLANDWRIVRRRVSGEYRMELLGSDLYRHLDQLRTEGVFTEKINYTTRFFLPTGDNAAEVFGRVTKYRPVVELVAPAEAYDLIEKSDLKPRTELDRYRVDKVRKLPGDIDLPNRKYSVDLFEAAHRLMSPARYARITRRMGAGSFTPGEIKVQSVENMATMSHELGHAFDYMLSGGEFPGSILKRFPAYKHEENKARLEYQLRKELRTVSNFMRPVEGGPAAFSAYRNNHVELMGDFYSLYFLDPVRARAMAPTVTAAVEAQLKENKELAAIVNDLHKTREQVAAGQAEVEKIRPEDDPTSLITPEEMETLPFPEIVKRLIIMRGRHHRMQVILASKRSDRWKNMVTEEQLEDIGAAVEGIGNLRTGSTYEQIMATMTPAMKQVMKEYQYHQEKLRELVNKYMAEVGPQEYISYLENYLPHFYVKPPRLKGGSNQGIARWAKHSPNAKARKFPTLQEAVDAGLIPITQNVAKLHVRWANINFRVATNRQFIEVLAKLPDETGMPVIRKPADAPADWKKVDHPAIRKVYARKAKDGTLILWEGGAAVHPEIYQATRQIFEMPFDGPTAKTIEMFNAIAKKIQLSFSFFHHWALSESGLASLTNIMRGKPLRAIVIVGDDEQTLGSGIRIPMTKLKVTMPHAVGLRLLKLEDFVRDATLSGMTSEALPDAQIGVVQKALESAEAYTRKVFGVGTAVRAVKKANEWWDRQLWDHLHAGLKAYTYYSIVGDVLAKAPDNVSKAELKKVKEKIGAAVNDMYGGQEWEAAFWLSPRARQASQALLLAPDWTYSNIKIAARLITDARDPVMGPVSRRYWFNMIMFFMLIINGLNYALNKKFTWQNEYGKDWDIDVTPIMHKMPWADKDSRYYVKPGKQFREVIRYVTEFDKIAGAKVSPLVHTVIEQVSGSQSGSNWDMPWKRDNLGWWESIPPRLLAVANKFRPFSLSGNNFAFTFPMSKGMTPWKAGRAYEDMIKAQVDPNLYQRLMFRKDYEKLRKELDDACRQNNLKPEELFSQSLSRVRGKYYTEMWRAVEDGNKKKAEAAAEKLIKLHTTPKGLTDSGKRRDVSEEDIKRAMAVAREQAKLTEPLPSLRKEVK